MELAELQDLRRDAEDILWTDIAVHIQDLLLEDLPEREEMHMLYDYTDDDRWEGIYRVENNAERMYEVSYNFDTKKFYVTTYLMTFCKKHDPPHEY